MHGQNQLASQRGYKVCVEVVIVVVVVVKSIYTASNFMVRVRHVFSTSLTRVVASSHQPIRGRRGRTTRAFHVNRMYPNSTPRSVLVDYITSFRLCTPKNVTTTSYNARMGLNTHKQRCDMAKALAAVICRRRQSNALNLLICFVSGICTVLDSNCKLSWGINMICMIFHNW